MSDPVALVIDLQEWKRLAQAATQGPWEAAECGGYMVMAGPLKKNTPGHLVGGRGVIAEMDDDAFPEDEQEANAHYIAAANPAAVLALIERVEEAERRASVRQQLLDAEKAERDALRERLRGAQEEAYCSLDAARAANEEAGRRSAEIEAQKKRAELAESRKEHTEYWYAVRLERLKDMAKERGFWREMAAILANGTAGSEPPTYAQQLNLAIGRAEDAEKKSAALLKRVSQFEALARAALLAFQYIEDRSAGSSEAWNALASALGMDPGESDVSEMVTTLRTLAAAREGR